MLTNSAAAAPIALAHDWLERRAARAGSTSCTERARMRWTPCRSCWHRATRIRAYERKRVEEEEANEAAKLAEKVGKEGGEETGRVALKRGLA